MAVVNRFVLSHANTAALDSLREITRITSVVSVGKCKFVVRLNSGNVSVKITMFGSVSSVACEQPASRGCHVFGDDMIY